MTFISQSLKVAFAAVAISAGLSVGAVQAAPSTGSSSGSAVSADQAFLNDLSANGVSTGNASSALVVDAAHTVCAALRTGQSRWSVTYDLASGGMNWNQASKFVALSAKHYCPAY
ncbi:DUF732 domain-containing protein [Nocardia sp. NPDC058666]|uniref:DUF732 domain-containing protein n=1 Tax=unclassified Nocardia TaxID=2637762 RepID=UPI003646C31D